MSLGFEREVPPGFEFFQRFPEEEMIQFQRLKIAAKENNQPLPIVCPICPDYDEQYRLADGIDETAKRVLTNLPVMAEFFGDNLPFKIEMHVADVEGFEPLILQTSRETTASFLEKTDNTIHLIQNKIEELQFNSFVSCTSMLSVFNQSGIDYFSRKKVNMSKIINSQGRKVNRALNSLIDERARKGHFNLVAPNDYRMMAAEELANYATYGELVNGQAVILSPDAPSPIPAYNFLREKNQPYNPTIFLKAIRERKSFYDL